MTGRIIGMLLLAVLAAEPAAGQALRPRPAPGETVRPAPLRPVPGHPSVDMLAQRRRLQELDRLLAAGNLSRAESLIGELAGHSWLARELMPRRIRLAMLKGAYDEAVQLCSEALAGQPRNANLWRELTEALLEAGRPDEARAAVDSFLVHAPDARNATLVAAELLDAEARPTMTVAFIDSMRRQLGDRAMLSRPRALGLLQAGRQEEAAAEVSTELRGNAFNLALLRADLLDGPFRPGWHDRFVAALSRLAAEPGAQPAEGILVVNLHLAAEDAAAAVALADQVGTTPPGQRAVLQNAAALIRELDLLPDEGRNRATIDYLLAVLEPMAGGGNPDRGLRRRAALMLAEAALAALDRGWLADDPQAAVDRFTGIADLVRAIDPGNPDLHAGQIRLAVFRRDVLGDAAGAARSLETMLLNLDLPLEGVALVRLTLGETWLAAQDTARARAVLTSLGRDPEFRQAGGHAHYLLARLDLAQLAFATARDRFAVVAMDNPAAPYANDALDLGLAVAEELDNPNGGPTLLARYASAVYWDLVNRPAERAEALKAFVAAAAPLADPTEPQRLLERALWELAELALANGRNAEALDLLARIVADHPDGRHAAPALLERSRLLAAAGDAAGARAALERLLSQYPDWLFADDARDALRSLP